MFSFLFGRRRLTAAETATAVGVLTVANAVAPGVGGFAGAALLTPILVATHSRRMRRRGGAEPITVGAGTGAGAVTAGRLHRIR